MKKIIKSSFCLLLVLTLIGCGSMTNRKAAPSAQYRAENEYMQLAIEEARDGIYNSDGGPFGSVVIKDGKVVGKGHNTVLKDNDSTCHGEISAIRDAEKALESYDLSGCVIYTTGEPCQMCLAACIWANIDHVYYGCSIKDNSLIGFRDEQIDNTLGGRANMLHYLEQLDEDACLKLFEEYNAMEKTIY